MTKENTKEKIKDLIERYKQLELNGKVNQFNEADVGSKFILPFIEALGWDIKNIDEVKEQKRTLTGPADYSLNINKRPKIIIEIKKFSEHLDNLRTVRGKKETYVEQAQRYCWWLKVDWFILTNFKEIRLYYSHVKKPEDGLVFKLKYNQVLKNFNKIWILSKESVISGELDVYEKRRMRNDVDKELLEDLIYCRKILVNNIIKNHDNLSNTLLKESVQKILDRILIIRVAEDTGVLGADTLWKELDSWKNRGLPTPFMGKLNNLFEDFDAIYNGKIFARHKCEELAIDNVIIEKIIDIWYKYNFMYIPADILGAIYENYLGFILKEGESGIDIVKNQKIRKKEGIYYTPYHVVEYIIKRITEIYFKDKSLSEISEVKILDPACGSGSFLIKFFDKIKEYYEEFNRRQVESALSKSDMIKFSKIYPKIEKKILNENLFGVDLDPQAIEITVVNLMLKGLKKGESLPLLLDKNMKCGNSLISGQEEDLTKFFGETWKEIRPFNWQIEFSEIFKNDGFDIIVGNPPHGAKLTTEERNFFSHNFILSKGYKNTASLFIEQSYKLLKEGGMLGLVIPKSLTFSQKWNPTRKFILDNFKIVEIVDISQAFPDVLLEQILLICRKSTKFNDLYLGTKLSYSDELVTFEVPINLNKDLDSLPIQVSPISLSIYKKIMDNSEQLKNFSHTSRGLPLQSKSSETKLKYSEPILKGADIRPYHYKKPSFFVEKNILKKYDKKIELLKKTKIVSQRIVAHILRPSDHIVIMSTLDQDGILNFDTVENTILTDSKYDIKYILAFLNSKLISWFVYTFIFNNAIRTMDFDKYYVGKIPIFRATIEQQEIFIKNIDKLLKTVNTYTVVKSDFFQEVNKVPRLDDKNLRFYYSKIPLENKKVLIHSNLKGNIKNIKISESDNFLFFQIDYEKLKGKRLKEYKNVKVLELKIEEKLLRKFIKFSIMNYKKTIGKGNILEKLLEIPIPFFDKNQENNKKVINEIMKSFIKINENQEVLENNIHNLEKDIDQLIYKYFNLNSKEIDYIESSFGSESKILHLLN